MLKYVNQFINLFVDTLKQIGRGSIWLTFLIYGLVIWVVLYAHYDFLSPAFYGLISEWTNLISESNAIVFTHYPGHFLLLPFFFGLAKVLVGLLIEGVILGGVAVLFNNSFLGTRKGERLRFSSVFSMWLHLTLAWAIINGLAMLITMNFYDWLQFFHQDSPRRLAAVEFAIVPFCLSVVLALFLFAIPAIAIYRENVIKAIGRSVKLFFRRPLTCIFLAAFILAVPLLMSSITGRAGDIVTKFRPELVYWLLVVSIGVDMVANFFWMGTSVRFLLDEEMS